MKLDKQQIANSLTTARNVDGVKLDEDMNLQERKRLLNDFRLRVDRLITQKKTVRIVAISDWAMESISDVEHKTGIYHTGVFLKKSWTAKYSKISSHNPLAPL